MIKEEGKMYGVMIGLCRDDALDVSSEQTEIRAAPHIPLPFAPRSPISLQRPTEISARVLIGAFRQIILRYCSSVDGPLLRSNACT